MKRVRQWLWRKVVETGFLETYPHFAPILATLRPVDDDGTPLMGVSREDPHVSLRVNVAAFEADDAGFRGVLQHELHHVLLGHVTDPAYREAEHPVIMQVAQEISANESITEHLPGRPIVWDDYARFGVRPGQTTWERYELLVRAHEEGRWEPPPGSCCLAEGEGDGEPLWARDLPAPLRRLMAGRRRSGWRGLTVGGSPGPETIAWRVVLRRFAASRPERRPSLRRPNRRDPGGRRLGELPGWSRRPGRRRLVVALDTSSSMDDDLFPRIRDELAALAATADVVVVECDEAIRREYPWEGRLESIEGRGGTSLEPPFAPDVLARHRPDGVVYFTDGDGPYPGTDPGVPTLWVLTGHEPFACPWGDQVRMFVTPPGEAV